jgi:hypothetical protein
MANLKRSPHNPRKLRFNKWTLSSNARSSRKLTWGHWARIHGTCLSMYGNQRTSSWILRFSLALFVHSKATGFSDSSSPKYNHQSRGNFKRIVVCLNGSRFTWRWLHSTKLIIGFLHLQYGIAAAPSWCLFSRCNFRLFQRELSQPSWQYMLWIDFRAQREYILYDRETTKSDVFSHLSNWYSPI